MSELDGNGIIHLIGAMHKFASYKGDVNIATVALELIRTTAYNIAMQKPYGASDEKMYEIWIGIITRLKDVGCDDRTEVRNRAYATIEQIFNDNGESIIIKVWSYTFQEIFTQLLHFVELHFFACRTEKGQIIAIATPTNIATPKFSLGIIQSPNAPRVMRFDEEAIKKEKIADDKSREKQWEESISSVLSTFVRIFKKFSQTSEISL
jgi:hypothetical protein